MSENAGSPAGHGMTTENSAAALTGRKINPENGTATENDLQRFWGWYEAASGAEKAKFQPYSDFGREQTTRPGSHELALWQVESGTDRRPWRSWPAGIADPGARAVTAPDETVLAERLWQFEQQSRRWAATARQ